MELPPLCQSFSSGYLCLLRLYKGTLTVLSEFFNRNCSFQLKKNTKFMKFHRNSEPFLDSQKKLELHRSLSIYHKVRTLFPLREGLIFFLQEHFGALQFLTNIRYVPAWIYYVVTIRFGFCFSARARACVSIYISIIYMSSVLCLVICRGRGNWWLDLIIRQIRSGSDRIKNLIFHV